MADKATQPPPAAATPKEKQPEKTPDEKKPEKTEKPQENEKDKEKSRGPPTPTPGPKPMTSEDVKSHRGKFTFGEMVDLALASPEVGAVNFNILRMLLKDMVERAGIAKLPVKVNEMEAHQVQNFKDYVQGSVVGSPMPGVLRIGQQGATPRQGAPPGHPRGPPPDKPPKTPPDGRGAPQQRPPPGQEQQQQTTSQRQAQVQIQADETADGEEAGGQKTPKSSRGPRPPPPPPSQIPDELLEKVDYLEKQLEALYQLPGNNELIEKAKAEGASVSDMWQIIQLNNRIAAAEAAIQKMASLIEDIAKNMGKLGSQARLLKKDAEGMQATTSDVQLQGQGCAEQCSQLSDGLIKMQNELNDIKAAWKKDRENLQQMLGVDLGKVPSFMTKPTKIKTKERPDREREGFERGTQTRKEKHTSTPHYHKKAVDEYIPPEDIAKMTPEQITKKITPEEVKQMTPQIYKDLTHDQKRAVNLIRKSMKSIMNLQLQRHHHFREPMGVANMPEEEIAELSPRVIAERMPYEEAVNLPADVLEKMTEAQKEKVQHIISRGPSPASPVEPGETPKKSMGVALMTDDQIQELPPAEIAKKMSVDEAKTLPASVLGQMNEEQKAAVKKVIEDDKQAAVAKKQKKEKKKPPLGLSMMTKDQLKNVTPEEIVEKLDYEEAKDLPQAVLDKLTPEKQEAVKGILNKGPPKGYKEKPKEKRKTQVGLASMSGTELEKVSGTQIAEMSFEEAKSVPGDILELMTEEQKKALQKVVEAGPVPSSPEGQYSELSEGEEFYEEYGEEDEYYDDGKSDMTQAKSRRQSAESRAKRPSWASGKSEIPVLSATEIDDIADIPAEDIANAITPEMAAAIPAGDMKTKFTKEQQKEIERLKKKLKKKRAEKAEKLTAEMASQMSPSELQTALTEDNVDAFTETDIQSLAPAQAKIVKDFRKSIGLHEYSDDSDLAHLDHEHEAAPSRKSKISKAPTKKGKKLARKKSKAATDVFDDHKHPHVDLVRGPLPTKKKDLPPISFEEYLSTLTPEQAAELAAEAVQRELEKQYKHLQQMQRQLAIDIQDKMEFIYSKLLKEIAVQQAGDQYMAIGEPEHLGPGVCTGHGMPAGIAVCKFPEVADKKPGTAIPEGQVCPGPGVCPASATCPHCGGQGPVQHVAPTEAPTKADAKERDHRDSVASSGKHRSRSPRTSEADDSLLRDMKSLILLDLEKIREDVRGKNIEYNEVDMVEKVGAIWEALKILKHNEEALAVKIARQDAFMKKLPPKLQKLTDDNVEAIISGKLAKAPLHMEGSRVGTAVNANNHDLPEALRRPQPGAAVSAAQSEDIQTLFNNLANVIAECAELKDKLDQISDTARILESDSVTKQMLVEALSDKVDKAMLSTKVSYEEFGNTVDEVHTQLHNLMVEGYQRNENWKKVTSELAAELIEKVDKVELAPLRTFFKSHLRNLEEKVKNLSTLIEEPDPAGTRKKLLKDYNCLSCDRMVNISGVTNGPTLPVIGPVLAGHPTASKRALDLHRMRMMRKYDPAKKNLNALERQALQNEKTRKNLSSAKKDNDLIHSVNRYTGGSHTGINNADLIASNSHRRPQTTPTKQDGNGTV